MVKEDALLEQYRTINSSLNIISEHHNSLFLFMLTASGAILTFSIQQDNFYIAIINLIILIILRCRVMSYRDEYFAKLVYLREVLEPRLLLDSKRMSRLCASKISNIHYFTPSILSGGTFVLYMFAGIHNLKILVAVVFLTIIIINLDIYYVFGSKKIYKKYMDSLTKYDNS